MTPVAAMAAVAPVRSGRRAQRRSAWARSAGVFLVLAAAIPPSRAASGEPVPIRSILAVDDGFTARSGALTLQAAHDLFADAEERTIGTRWFDENAVPPRLAGVALRYLKLGLIDVPAAHSVFLIGHEVYGHGGRMREVGYDPSYHLEWPHPYGKGGGAVSRESLLIPGRVVTSDEQLVISGIGGFEVAGVQRRELDVRWAERETIRLHEALFFLRSFQEDQDYVWELEDDLDLMEPGHDVAFYLRSVNERSGFAEGSDAYYQPRQLRRAYYVNLANPYLAQALFTIVKNGLWDGSGSGRLRMIPLGPARWLPCARVSLEPFGPAYHLENTFVLGRRAYVLDLSLGDPAFPDEWGGVTLGVRRLLERPTLTLDAESTLWSQPGFELGGARARNAGRGLGGAFSIRSIWSAPRRAWPASAVVEAGYKSAGYREGWPLDGGFQWMLGVALSL